eukprot:gene3910-13981_t
MAAPSLDPVDEQTPLKLHLYKLLQLGVQGGRPRATPCCSSSATVIRPQVEWGILAGMHFIAVVWPFGPLPGWTDARVLHRLPA